MAGVRRGDRAIDRNVRDWSESGHNGSRNAWEYFFLPMSELRVEHVLGDPAEFEGLDAAQIANRVADRAVVRNDYLAHDTGFAGRIDERQRAACARLVQRYIRLRPEVVAAVDDFHERHLRGHHVVGVHYRGTDKVMEVALPPFERYRRALDAQVAAHPTLRIFAASDCARFLDELTRVYGDRVVSTSAHRSTDGRPIHYGYTRGAEEVLIDAVLLSRCEHFVHGVSNVSAAVLVFNPALAHTDLDGAEG